MSSTAYPLHNGMTRLQIALRPLWLLKLAKVMRDGCWHPKLTTAKLMRWRLALVIGDYVTGQARADKQWRRLLGQREKQAFDCKVFVKKINDAAMKGRGGSRGVGSCGVDGGSHNRAPLLTPPFYSSPFPNSHPANEANKKET